MTKKLELYKCHICGNLIQVILDGEGELVCCGEVMERLEAKYEENNELGEKHSPKIIDENGLKKITLEHHPMIPEHYIQFIEAISKDKSKVYLKYLNPNSVAEFEITDIENIEAIEYCNIHGLWRSNND